MTVRSGFVGVLATCLAAAGCSGPSEPVPPARARNLVVVSLDTVRRDHLPTYGYARDTAPAIDRLAADAAVFVNAFSQEVNTDPSHTSMFTGLYPHTHGTVRNGQRLRGDRTPLAEMLAGAGFATGGFVGGLPMSARASGLERGFDVYDDRFDDARRDGGTTTARALAWLAGLPAGQRYFLFVHFYDAHGPYVPAPGYEERFRSPDREGPLARIPPYQRIRGAPAGPSKFASWYRDRYDATIRYQDDRIAELLDAIDLDETVVVVLSDHGETFDERYWQLDHGGQVFDEQIRIPLVVRVPGFEPRRIDDPVETVDLTPTALELLGVPAPDGLRFQGRSLVSALAGGAAGLARNVFSSAEPLSVRHADRGYRLDEHRRIDAVRNAGWKLIRYPGVDGDAVELYRLDLDPGEHHDVVAQHPEVARELLAILVAWREDRVAETVSDEDRELPDELREKLRSLGYVQ